MGRRRAGGRVLLGGLALLGAVVALLVLVALGVRLTHGDQALPGTHVAGISVAGSDAAQIGRRLSPATAPGAHVTLSSSAGDTTRTRAQLGYRVDLDATVQRALDAGRSGTLGGLPATLGGLLNPRDVALAATIDARTLDAQVAALAKRVDRKPFAGGLTISPQTLAVETQAPRSGRLVDQRLLSARIRSALLDADGPRRTVAVPLSSKPAPSTAAVADVGRQADEYLTAPLKLSGDGAQTELSPAQIAPLLTVEAAGGQRVRLGVRQDKLRELVTQVAARLDRPPRDARIAAPATGLATLDAKGNASWQPKPVGQNVTVEAGRPGRTVKRAQLQRAIADAIHSGKHTAALALERAEPRVSTAQAARMTALIGTFTTAYPPGQPRVTNIQTIARAVDGTVVPPGKTFSLNETAGQRTTAKGYVEAPFIADGRIVPSVGGGVSQFSTTLYNAAYFAGLKIETHRPHSLFIDRYPPGREATLNYPDIDMRWTNDTDVPVLIRAEAGADHVTVSLYGDTGGRRVSAETGARKPVPGGNFSITVTRVVHYPGGRVERQPFTTRYDNEQPASGE